MANQTSITESSPHSSLRDRIDAFARLPYRAIPYRSRNWGHGWHSLCSYPSKLKPSIAYHLVEYFSKPDDVIMDPFSGVGTIPFEACLNGRVGVGIDLNPLAFHTTLAKVSMPSRKEILADFMGLRAAVNSGSESTETVPDEIREFFHRRTLQELVNARAHLLHEFEKQPRPSVSFLFANVAHILHGNRPYALSRRSHNIIPIPPRGDFVYKSLLDHCRKRISRYLRMMPSTKFRLGNAFLDSVLEFDMEDGGVDAIMTSPPFFGNTEFLRQNRVRIWFCGWGYERQDRERSRFVDYMDLPVYLRIFERLDSVLNQDKLCILHLGVVKKKDMALSILPYAEKAGFEKLGLIYEDVTGLETHGRTDRGGTHKHQFLILGKAH